MVRGSHGAALRQALDAFGTSAAGAVKRQPMATGLEPGFQSGTLLGPWVGASDVGDEKPAHGQPFLQVGEVVGDRRRNLSLVQQREEPKASIVVVVTGAGAGGKAAGNDMRAVVDDIGHVVPPYRWMPNAIASITPPLDTANADLRRPDLCEEHRPLALSCTRQEALVATHPCFDGVCPH